MRASAEKTRPARRAAWTGLIALALGACAKPAPPELEDPIDGLTDEELERFEEGELIFEGEFAVEQGLGPLFNANACSFCHIEPATGGNGSVREIHATGIGEEGACDPLLALGGPVFQQRVTPALKEALGIDAEPIPDQVKTRAMRSTPDIFGFGLLDAVSDATILALADPLDRDKDGISGRPNRFPDGRVGRFGRKAFLPSLAQFNEGAFLLEMGITTPNGLEENTVAGAPLPAGVDPLPEPELSAEKVALTDSYVRFLAPPAPAELSASAHAGKALFERVGCAKCHVPYLRTGDNPVKALAHRQVFAYTDLLLHDMGPELADICLGEASPSEFRTEPLMGLRHASAFLHDGRATTIEEAIQAHDGEARASREAFTRLASKDREALLAFLKSL